jgi:probable rRNA maturation factor
MSGVTLVIEDEHWRAARIQASLKRAAAAAARAARLKGDFTILLAGDARLKALNHDFRARDKATNVLSFPSGEAGYAGDIAIAYGVTAAEARAEGKRFADHARHLVVHGVLHLAGFDHERPRDAKVMEPMEVRILKSLGIADPYQVRT